MPIKTQSTAQKWHQIEIQYRDMEFQEMEPEKKNEDTYTDK